MSCSNNQVRSISNVVDGHLLLCGLTIEILDKYFENEVGEDLDPRQAHSLLIGPCHTLYILYSLNSRESDLQLAVPECGI